MQILSVVEIKTCNEKSVQTMKVQPYLNFGSQY